MGVLSAWVGAVWYLKLYAKLRLRTRPLLLLKEVDRVCFGNERSHLYYGDFILINGNFNVQRIEVNWNFIQDIIFSAPMAILLVRGNFRSPIFDWFKKKTKKIIDHATSNLLQTSNLKKSNTLFAITLSLLDPRKIHSKRVLYRSLSGAEKRKHALKIRRFCFVNTIDFAFLVLIFSHRLLIQMMQSMWMR